MIKAIVFDIGGVLADLDAARCLKAFREEIGYPRMEEMLGLSEQKGIFGEMERGTRTAEEFCEAIAAESREGTRPEDVFRCLQTFITDVPKEKTDLMDALAEKYPLYFLSNNNPIAMDITHRYFDENGFDWRNKIRKEFLSYQMHLMKPGADFFLEAIRQIGLLPEEILFVDDSKANVEAALSVGMRALHYEPGADLAALILPEL